MDTWLENLKNISTNSTFLGVRLVDETGGAMHKLLSDQETIQKHRNEETWDGNADCWCTYDKGEPASSLGPPPGWKDGEGWAEDSTDVGEGC